ncbi:MAG: hypothetical protein ACYC09_12980 [Bacteroidota bacterium]
MSKITTFTEQAAASVAAADLALTVDISAGSSGTKKIKEGNLAQAHEILKYFTDTGTANAKVITTGLSLTALTAGMVFAVEAVAANTGAATLAVDSVGAVTIVKHGADALSSGDIAAGMVFMVQYDGTNFQLLNPKATSSGSILVPVSVTWDMNLGAATTVYMGFCSVPTADPNPANVPNVIGLYGTVVAAYLTSRSNTLSANGEMRLWVDGATTDVAIPLLVGETMSSYVGESLELDVVNKVQVRWVVSGGSGSLVRPSLTLMLKVPLVAPSA